MIQVAFWLTLTAACATGLLAGASLDQSIKQLPARHRIGVEAYSAYSQAADLSNGKLFYGILGIGAALLTVAAAVAIHMVGLPARCRAAVDLAAICAVLHTLTTTRAAPLLLSQRNKQGEALAALFDRFNRWQTARAVIQVLNYGVLLWVVVEVAAVR
jgi:hypothetical protein